MTGAAQALAAHVEIPPASLEDRHKTTAADARAQPSACTHSAPGPENSNAAPVREAASTDVTATTYDEHRD